MDTRTAYRMLLLLLFAACSAFPALADPMSNPLARAKYTFSAHALKQLPPDTCRDVAFAGRSNDCDVLV